MPLNLTNTFDGYYNNVYLFNTTTAVYEEIRDLIASGGGGSGGGVVAIAHAGLLTLPDNSDLTSHIDVSGGSGGGGGGAGTSIVSMVLP